MPDCSPVRPSSIVINYPGKGTLTIDLNADFKGKKIDALVFDLRKSGYPKECGKSHPGNWQGGPAHNDPAPPPGCCLVDGVVVCWD